MIPTAEAPLLEAGIAPAAIPARPQPRPTFWLTRFVLLRLLGLVYFTAFLVAANQNVALIGHGGLLPADVFLHRVEEHLGSPGKAFLALPSLFWWKLSDQALVITAWTGVALSAVVVCGYPWTVHFVWKLLLNDPATLGLIAGNPFPKAPPKNVRAILYRYHFAPPGNQDGAWWTRERVGEWLPPLSLKHPQLLQFLEVGGLIRLEQP